MLLKKISLDNFRCFKGHHEMLFSTDKEKNVTLVFAGNGTGKTTMVQAFQWILYGKVEEFNDKVLLNSILYNEMQENDEQEVRAEIELEHKNTDYKIIRTQLYKKDASGKVKGDYSKLSISQKDKFGNTSFKDAKESLSIVNGILPESLSKYFFFSGERIDTMSKEALRGKVYEFRNAVQNILGLDVLNKAMEHLKPTLSGSVVGKYNAKLDENGDQKTKELRSSLYEKNEIIEKNQKRIEEINPQIDYYQEEIKNCKEKLLQYKEVEGLQEELNQVKNDIENYGKIKKEQIGELLSKFEKTYKYMSSKLIRDCLDELKDTNNIDKGIPDIRKTTIDFLMNRGVCICGTDLHDENCEAVANLRDLLKYIPPESLGTQINEFQKTARSRMRESENFYEEFKSKLRAIKTTENHIEEKERKAGEYNEKILNSKNESISSIKNEQTNYECMLSKLQDELVVRRTDVKIAENDVKKINAEISDLELKNKQNSLIEMQRNYAAAAYQVVKKEYEENEVSVRNGLEEKINDLFTQIYDDGMTISLDENYKIKASVNGLEAVTFNLDQNTAKSYSIIFAFIVGVLQMAKEKVEEKQGTVSVNTSGEYPLVMDAPLSSFDKERIKNICEVIPQIARQVIIFIKDTDGDIAEKYLMSRVGVSYTIKMNDPSQQLDNYFEERGGINV